LYQRDRDAVPLFRLGRRPPYEQSNRYLKRKKKQEGEERSLQLKVRMVKNGQLCGPLAFKYKKGLKYLESARINRNGLGRLNDMEKRGLIASSIWEREEVSRRVTLRSGYDKKLRRITQQQLKLDQR